jgi:hypothetical protein
MKQLDSPAIVEHNLTTVKLTGTHEAYVLARYLNWRYNLAWCNVSFCRDKEKKSVGAV